MEFGPPIPVHDHRTACRSHKCDLDQAAGIRRKRDRSLFEIVVESCFEQVSEGEPSGNLASSVEVLFGSSETRQYGVSNCGSGLLGKRDWSPRYYLNVV